MSTLVQDLVRGSDELNRMRREIQVIVSLLFTFVPSARVQEWKKHDTGYVQLPRGPSGVYWTLGFCSGKAYNQLSFSLEGKILPDNSEDYHIYSCVQGAVGHMSHHSVTIVYKALPQLLTQFLELFPESKEKLAPFLEAAKIS